MKNFLLLLITSFTSNLIFGQLKINPGVQWVNEGAAVIVLNNIDLINNGTITAGGSVVKFTGNSNNIIGGSTASSFHELEMAKAGSNKVSLSSNISVGNKVVFTSGLLDLNQHDLTLAGIAYLANESEASRVTGVNGGEIIITLPLDAPVASNPGNLGAVITSSSNMGAVTIRRGHAGQSGSGMASSIQRYFDISPANNAALSATFRYYYFDAEMNSQSENVMEMYRSTDAGATWTNQSLGSRNITENFVEKTGINSFSRWTLSSSGGPLPVTGLEFTAKRINSNQVQLNWKTLQEFNNKGFSIERKKENENNFTTTGFVNSLAAGGNSSTPLTYSKIDENNFTGITYYYLKQEDINGRFSYSVTRVVSGSIEKTMSLKVWPIPSQGDINVMLQGVEKDVLQVFDMSGRLVKQLPVLNNTQQKINGLTSGSYIIRLANQNDLVQKIIIQ